MAITSAGKRLSFAALLVVWLTSGIFILYITEINPQQPRPSMVVGLPKIVYGIHIATWMLLGMLANYLWDLFRNGKSWEDILLRDVFLPMLVSPIVFFGIWALWPGATITFALCLIAFQNGFFWQVVFSKASPFTGSVVSVPTIAAPTPGVPAAAPLVAAGTATFPAAVGVKSTGTQQHKSP